MALPFGDVGWSAVVIAAFPEHTHYFNWSCGVLERNRFEYILSDLYWKTGLNR